MLCRQIDFILIILYSQKCGEPGEERLYFWHGYCTALSEILRGYNGKRQL